jgi:hypothetical protein
VELTEIGGWGEKTLVGIAYSEGVDTVCADPRAMIGCTSFPALSVKPIEVIDGDGTVVIGSSLWTPLSTGVKKYWVNLRKYGASVFGITINRKHADILEVPALRSLIGNIIEGTSPIDASNQDFISTTPPQAGPGDDWLRFLLHSPLDLNLYDDHGNHTGISTTTGLLEENIPGSRYKRYGELKLVEAPASTTLRLVMDGYASGSFTLDIDKMTGNDIIASTTFAGVPSSTSTRAMITVPLGGETAQASPLSVDYDGDGSTDFSLLPLGGMVHPDVTPPLTVASTSGRLGLNSRYTSNIEVQLTATDTGSGVKNTYYSLSEGIEWGTYTAPVTITNEGTTTLLYYSIDRAGNKEATSTLTITIDKTAPKAIISVDPAKKDLRVDGDDSAGSTTITKSGDTYTITDQAGHTTKLFFQKTYSGKRLSYAKLTKVQYDDGVITTLPSSYFVYLWQVTAPQTLLSQTIVVNETYVIEALYDKTKNKTTVFLKKKGVIVQTQQFTGLRIVQFTVDKGVVGYGI